MKKIYSICATMIIAASITYGIMTTGSGNDLPLRLALISLVMMFVSLGTIFIAQDYYPDNKTKHHAAIGFLGGTFSICIILGIYAHGPYWLLIPLIIGMLWLTPNPATSYFSAILLGTTGILLFLVIEAKGFILSPCIHFGCVVIFALSTWIRVYFNFKK